jgi:hypothetical protein
MKYRCDACYDESYSGDDYHCCALIVMQGATRPTKCPYDEVEMVYDDDGEDSYYNPITPNWRPINE